MAPPGIPYLCEAASSLAMNPNTSRTPLLMMFGMLCNGHWKILGGGSRHRSNVLNDWVVHLAVLYISHGAKSNRWLWGGVREMSLSVPRGILQCQTFHWGCILCRSRKCQNIPFFCSDYQCVCAPQECLALCFWLGLSVRQRGKKVCTTEAVYACQSTAKYQPRFVIPFLKSAHRLPLPTTMMPDHDVETRVFRRQFQSLKLNCLGKSTRNHRLEIPRSSLSLRKFQWNNIRVWFDPSQLELTYHSAVTGGYISSIHYYYFWGVFLSIWTPGVREREKKGDVRKQTRDNMANQPLC